MYGRFCLDVCLCTRGMWYPWKPEEGIESSGPRVKARVRPKVDARPLDDEPLSCSATAPSP